MLWVFVDLVVMCCFFFFYWVFLVWLVCGFVCGFVVCGCGVIVIVVWFGSCVLGVLWWFWVVWWFFFKIGVVVFEFGCFFEWGMG